MMGSMAAQADVVLVRGSDWRVLRVVVPLLYFVLCLGVLYFGTQWWQQRSELAAWRDAYCEQGAHLWALRYPSQAIYLDEELNACRNGE